MKIITTLLFLLIICTTTNAQRQVQYSQAAKTHELLNPAYNDSINKINALLLYRNQWVGIEGSPSSQSFKVYMPSSARGLGFGLSLTNQKWAFYNNLDAFASVSYTILFRNYRQLSFGLQAGINTFKEDAGKIVSTGTYTNEKNSYVFPNTGFGIYYNSRNFFAGFAIPQMLHQNTESQNDKIVTSNNFTMDRLPMYLITGYNYEINKNIKIKPLALLRYMKSTAIQLDISASVLLKNKLEIGLGWRSGDALIALAGYRITKFMSLTYSYDYTLSELNLISKGSHEISLTFDFYKKGAQTYRMPGTI